LEPGLIFKEYSVTSLGMPSISEGFHVKMSLFVQRKSTSALSYLGESEAPMRATFPSGLLGSIKTSLVTSVGSEDPADHLESGAYLVASSLMTASSSEAMVAVASS
jgi:hypothetical protein